MFDPKYSISPSMLGNISEIAEIKAAIERSRVLPLNEAQLRRQAILRMAHTSTSIEGNKLAEFEVGKVFEGKEVRAPEKDVIEVRNYYEAIQELEKIADQKSPLTIEEVLSLHKTVIKGLVDKEKAGHFRPGDVFVLDDLGNGKEMLRFKAPPAEKVPFLVKNLLEWLEKATKEGVHPVIRAGIFHLQFVTIHPFTDGNGRIARLLTQLLLYRSGWDFRKIIVLEDFYNRDRMSYYNAEHEVQGFEYNEKNDMTPWLEYFVHGFLVEARKALEQIQSIGYGRVNESTEQIFLDRDEIQIMDFLTTTGRVTSDDVVDVLGIAKRTAQLKLKVLAEKGLVQMQGKGPATYYVLKV